MSYNTKILIYSGHSKIIPLVKYFENHTACWKSAQGRVCTALFYAISVPNNFRHLLPRYCLQTHSLGSSCKVSIIFPWL